MAICVCLCMLTFFGSIGNMLAEWLTGVRPYAETGEMDYSNPSTLKAYRIAVVFSNVGGFLLASILFAWFCTTQIRSYFRFNSGVQWKHLGLILICFFLAIPAIQMLSELNEMISGGSYLMDAQEETSNLRSALLQTDGIGIVLLNVLTMALLPAIGEELFFRGVILRLAYQGTKRMHVGVLLSAILFALVHLEFNNFLAIVFMGMLLGYLYVYTGSLLIPMGLHFLNNAVYILLESTPSGAEFTAQLESDNNVLIWLIVGAAALLLFTYLLKRASNKGSWNEMEQLMLRDEA